MYLRLTHILLYVDCIQIYATHIDDNVVCQDDGLNTLQIEHRFSTRRIQHAALKTCPGLYVK
jgi:hypothetical protein